MWEEAGFSENPEISTNLLVVFDIRKLKPLNLGGQLWIAGN